MGDGEGERTAEGELQAAGAYEPRAWEQKWGSREELVGKVRCQAEWALCHVKCGGIWEEAGCRMRCL